MLGYQFKIINKKSNMLLDFVSGSSSMESPISTPITQESREKMCPVHDGQVNKYVENGLAEALDGVSEGF